MRARSPRSKGAQVVQTPRSRSTIPAVRISQSVAQARPQRAQWRMGIGGPLPSGVTSRGRIPRRMRRRSRHDARPRAHRGFPTLTRQDPKRTDHDREIWLTPEHQAAAVAYFRERGQLKHECPQCPH